MTREEAITVLNMVEAHGLADEAKRMAIEALQRKERTMRLIDADALSEKLCETTIFIKDGEVFQRMINDAPTVSAEAVQGKWIRKTEVLNNDGQQGRYYWHECDQCGERPPYTKFMNENLSNYCPACGAKMSKGGDAE